MTPIYISILIVTYNSAAHILKCLTRLQLQSYSNFEVVLIDNASSDKTTELVKPFRKLLKLRTISMASNIGFSAANNLGAKLAQGNWLATLNPDAFPHTDWLENLVTFSQVYPDSFFASRLVQSSRPGYLDGEGDCYHISGIAWRKNYNLPLPPTKELFTEPQEVFSACAAAAMYPRKEFLAAGGFDEDFFAYHEDVDLGFRLRLNGLRCLFLPTAIVEHFGSASTGQKSDFVIYHGHRNLVWTFAKDMPTVPLLLLLPLHILMNIFFIILFSVQGRSHIIFKAKIDALKGLSGILKKRRRVQQRHQVPLKTLLSAMEFSLLSLYQTYIMRRNMEAQND